MWSRIRFDIAWRDLRRGAWWSVTSPRTNPQFSLTIGERALPTLSLRSAFDLLLQELNLPQGSEVLMSAITIPEMIRIVEHHGLIPVPVDLDDDFQIDRDSLEQAVNSSTRVLVVAHLFGARPDISPLCDWAHERGLVVIEDCAQAWCGRKWWGCPAADARLFSFGPIKTATALGGGLAVVRDALMLERMRAQQQSSPMQSRWSFQRRIVKYAILKLLTLRPFYAMLIHGIQWLGRDVDATLNKLTRGFQGRFEIARYRQQPCLALVKMMHQRINSYPEDRLTRRIENADGFAEHSHWLIPVTSEEPEPLLKRLRQQGFDAAMRGKLVVVPAPEQHHTAANAEHLLASTVLLPNYPEMPRSSARRMLRIASARRMLRIASARRMLRIARETTPAESISATTS